MKALSKMQPRNAERGMMKDELKTRNRAFLAHHSSFILHHFPFIGLAADRVFNGLFT
jgi:hypothetical protein